MRTLVLLTILLATTVAHAQKEPTPLTVTFSTNAHAQKTDRYRGIDRLALRRGSVVTLKAKGLPPHTKLRIEATAHFIDDWQGETAYRGAQATVTTTVPANAPIGRSDLSLLVDDKPVWTQPAIILFELPDEALLPDAGEFLFKETGAVWLGTKDAPEARPWAYDQFDAGVLSFALDVVDALDDKARRDPVLVARALAQRSQQVVSGRWDGEYSDGKQPGFWSGSTQILDAYRTTRRPAKYGQSMVFACVTTSLHRAVGIPARPTTGYDFVSEKGGDLVRLWGQGDDGVWTETTGDSKPPFRVWSVAFIARPDLKSAGGWQAFDATPQETTSGPSDEKTSRVSGPIALTQLGTDKQFDAGFVPAERRAKIEAYDVRTPAVPFYTVTVERVAVSGGSSTVFPIDSTAEYALPSEPVQNVANLDVAVPALVGDAEFEVGLTVSGEKALAQKLAAQVTVQPYDEQTGRAVGPRTICGTSGWGSGGTAGVASASCKSELARKFPSSGLRVEVVVTGNGALLAATTKDTLLEEPRVALRSNRADGTVTVRLGRREAAVSGCTLTLAGAGIDASFDLGQLIPGVTVTVDAPDAVLAGARGRVAATVSCASEGSSPIESSFLRLAP